MTLTAAPTISTDALTYLQPAWLDQPWGAHVTDQAYLEWEAAYDRLVADAEHGIPAALEAVEVIDAEVTATIRRVGGVEQDKLSGFPGHPATRRSMMSSDLPTSDIEETDMRDGLRERLHSSRDLAPMASGQPRDPARLFPMRAPRAPAGEAD